MKAESKRANAQFRIMQLRRRAVKYQWKKRRVPFTNLMTIPARLRRNIIRSPTFEKEVPLWKVFRHWEIVQEMREALPDRRINSNDDKLKLIRLWIELCDPTLPQIYYCELYWQRHYRFDHRHFLTAWKYIPKN